LLILAKLLDRAESQSRSAIELAKARVWNPSPIKHKPDVAVALATLLTAAWLVGVAVTVK
jgi:hypothetical protein